MQQLPLFHHGRQPLPSAPLAEAQPLTATASLAAAVQAYGSYLATSALSKNTARNFACDVAMMQRFVGPGKPIGEITPTDLTAWVASLHTAGRQLSAKTINRRVSAIRNFFTWLQDSGVLPANPAANVHCRRIAAPLPVILTERECEQLLALAAPSARAHLIVSLLLATGIKKGELTALKPSHFDLSNAQAPTVWILHETAKRHKDRRLLLPPETAKLVEAYLATRSVTERIFDCTDRNVEYILKDLERRLGAGKKVTAQILRDTYAVRQLQAGAPIDEVIRKLGLAPSEWNQEVREKYLKLASAPL